MDGISVKQSIEIETKGYATLMMNDKTSETNTHANTPSNRTTMSNKPNRITDILVNIASIVTVTGWAAAVVLLIIKLGIWVFQ